MNLPPQDPVRARENEENLPIEPVQFTRAESEQRRPRWRVRPVPAVITVLFAALVATAWFMFTARAVRLAIDPAPDRVDVAGGLFVYKLGERYLVRPGTYRVDADKAGYRSLADKIVVGDEAEQTFHFALAKLPGALTVSTHPNASVSLFIDQKPAGSPPVRIPELEAGRHDLAVRSDRYLPFDGEIEIEGMGKEQEFVVQLSPAWGDVTIETSPPGATVLVDGEQHGTTPVTAQVLRGKREIQLRLSGYKTRQIELDIEAGQSYPLPPVTLIPADGTLSLTSLPDGASVTIAGAYRGQTPLRLKLAPGKRYALALSKAGFQPANRTLDVRPDEDIDLAIRLQPVLGVVQLVVTPPGGQLEVDGKIVGDPNQRLSLSAASHHLIVRKEGYAAWDSIVTPRPGFEQQIPVELKTVEQARADAIPKEIKTAGGQEMRLILVPARLTLGAPRREQGSRPNEAERVVNLTRSFYVSTTEVTNQQFRAFSAGHDSGTVGRAVLNYEDRPVVNVTWEEAAAYANWLSERDGLPPVYRQQGEKWIAAAPIGRGYRLPTEAEWAWVARYAGGRKPSLFPWGNARLPVEKTANIADVTARDLAPDYYLKDYDDGYLGTSPVGTFPPNPLGLYDLAGNAAEWIHDVYVANPPVSGEPTTDPTGPEQGEYHVIRGSSFMQGSFRELRWTYRDYGVKPRPDVGFRLARYLDDASAGRSANAASAVGGQP